ncbi:MAG: PEGA domain-containing protein [Candidatus Uhrbacteria bacterium]|nr:PEGA domain-containing protein [Candidatus Uhrbacteria bacterium]
MNKVIRRIIFICFVLFFFISAAVLLIYASGYRYNIGKKGIEKTGQLLVESEPKGAQISLNGSPALRQWSHETLTTPTTVPYLFAGEYRLGVSRSGFHDWNGLVTVYPGRTTIKNDIFLLRNASPILVSAKDHIRSSFAVSDGIVFDDGRAIYLLNTRTYEVSTLYSSPVPILDLKVAPSGTRFVVKNTDGWLVIEQGQVSATIKETQKQPTEFRWAKSADTLYMSDDKGIAVFDGNTKTFDSFVMQSTIADFFVDNELVVLRNDANPSITFFDTKSGGRLRDLSFTPRATNIWGSEGGYLVLKNGGGSFYLLDRSAVRPVFQHVSDAHNIVFSTANHFFTYNDFEIWSHDFSNDAYTRSLITRQSERLSHVIPLSTFPAVITVSNNKDIRVRDLRARDESSAKTLLASFDSITAVFLGQKETTLIVFGSRDGKSGVYSLPLIQREELFPLVK